MEDNKSVIVDAKWRRCSCEQFVLFCFLVISLPQVMFSGIVMVIGCSIALGVGVVSNVLISNEFELLSRCCCAGFWRMFMMELSIHRI